MIDVEYSAPNHCQSRHLVMVSLWGRFDRKSIGLSYSDAICAARPTKPIKWQRSPIPAILCMKYQ